MLSFLSYENFNGDIIRGLFLRQPNLDLLRVQDVDDPIILEWATINNRILLTHDRATMPDFAYERLNKGKDMAGMFVINDRMPTRQVIDELILLVDCSEQTEWKDIILYLPI